MYVQEVEVGCSIWRLCFLSVYKLCVQKVCIIVVLFYHHYSLVCIESWSCYFHEIWSCRLRVSLFSPLLLL